jgi:hypothetical protein
MLPESSNTNITLGKTDEVDEVIKGALDISVTAAWAWLVAVSMISPTAMVFNILQMFMATSWDEMRMNQVVRFSK